MMTVRMLLLLVVASLSLCGALAQPNVAGLSALRQQSRDRVITLTDEVLSEFIMGRSRPYSAVIYYSAQQVSEGNPSLKLDELRREYAYAAKAFAAGPDADKVFFFEAALEVTQKPFAMLQVNSLPYVVRIPGSQAVAQATLELPKADKMLPENTKGAYPWPAETFVAFVSGRTGAAAAEIDRPSIYKSPFFPPVIFGGVLTAAYLGYKVYALGALRHSAIWAVLSLAVFWFSASGGMYNIIRGMPFFIRDRNGRLQFFLTSRQGQLGAEGFMLGTLYLMVGGSLAFVTYLAPRISSSRIRDSCSLVGALIAASSMYQTFKLWNLKTGYKHVSYF
eukprot:XP_001699273.1 OST3/OST6 family protein [Chlamydomonas reinhardtii]